MKFYFICPALFFIGRLNMKRAIIVLQIVLIFTCVCIFCFTSMPKLTGGILCTAVMLILIFIGAYTANANSKRLQMRITELLRELSVASSRIISVSQEIGITIDENNVSSNELFDDTRQMSDLTADVTENLGDMISQIKGLINFAEESQATTAAMEQTSNKSLAAIQNGMSEIMHIVDTMKEIKVTSSKASCSIEKLKTASDAVRTIIEKINEISQQMHIIAINATVEAARAGKYGSSFAVVAKEFHSLSSMTDTSMQDISALIDAIQKDISDVYNVVMENSGRVDEGVQYSRVVENSLKDIDASFSDVVKMVDKISAIAEEESRIAGSIGDRIDHVESLIDKTNGNVKRVFESAQNQKRGIENIAEMGTKLGSASMELISIAGNNTDEVTEKLDDKTKAICASFFPVIKKELCVRPDILIYDHALHSDMLSRFMSAHKLVEAVWTNELNGRFICSIPKAGIANAAMRDWFRASLKGESYISPIYISGITKNKCVTLSMPYADEHGEARGIIGVDLNLDLLKSESK
jgi:methyl-accepting chemotaxis protein